MIAEVEQTHQAEDDEQNDAAADGRQPSEAGAVATDSQPVAQQPHLSLAHPAGALAAADWAAASVARRAISVQQS